MSEAITPRLVTTADTFDTWRKITNGIISDSTTKNTAGQIYLDNFDWTNRISKANYVNTVDGTSENAIEIGSNTFTNDDVYYDADNGGVRVTAATTTGQALDGNNKWMRVSLGIPLDQMATYRVKVRVKNLRTDNDGNLGNRFYAALAGVNKNGQLLATDASDIFNYFQSAALPLDTVQTYSDLYFGMNSIGASDGLAGQRSFDPGAISLDLVLINHYTGSAGYSSWADVGDDIIIESISVERQPTGLIVSEHDETDNYPIDPSTYGEQNSNILSSTPSARMYLGMNYVPKLATVTKTNGTNPAGTSNNLDHSTISVGDYSVAGTSLFTKGNINTGNGSIIFADPGDSTVPAAGNAALTNNRTAGFGNIDHFYHDDTNGTNTSNPSNAVPGQNGGGFHFVSDGLYKLGYTGTGKVFTYATNQHNCTLYGGAIVGDETSNTWDGTSGNRSGVNNSLKNPLFITSTRSYSGTNAPEQEVVPMLHLAIGSNNATSSGAGPGINFYTPDSTVNVSGQSTANDGTYPLHAANNVKQTHAGLGAQIAAVKSESASSAYGTADLVFKVGTNRTLKPTFSEDQNDLQEILRLMPQHQDSGQGREVKVGSTEHTANLNVTNNVYVKGVNYVWPDSLTESASGIGNGEFVLAGNPTGNVLRWRSIGTITQNQIVYNRTETLPIGSIVAFPGDSSSLPTGFAECNGQAVNSSFRTSNSMTDDDKSALFAALGSGSKYGGSLNNFNLPNYDNKFLRGSSNTSAPGAAAGSNTGSVSHSGNVNGTKLTANQSGIRSHNHSASSGNHFHYVAKDGRVDFGVGAVRASEPVASYADDGSESYNFRRATGTANVGRTSSNGVTVTVNSATAQSAIDNHAHSYSFNKSFSTIPSFVSVTWAIKVRKDLVAELNVITTAEAEPTTVSSNGTATDNAAVLTGNYIGTDTNGSLGFATTKIGLTQGHPVWQDNGFTAIMGADFRMNGDKGKSNFVTRDGVRRNTNAEGDSARTSGRALVASLEKNDTNAHSGLVINYDNDFGGVSIDGTKINAPNLTQALIASGSSRTLTTKEYVVAQVDAEAQARAAAINAIPSLSTMRVSGWQTFSGSSGSGTAGQDFYITVFDRGSSPTRGVGGSSANSRLIVDGITLSNNQTSTKSGDNYNMVSSFVRQGETYSWLGTAKYRTFSLA